MSTKATDNVKRFVCQEEHYKHRAHMTEIALELEQLAKSQLIDYLDIKKSVSDLDDAIRSSHNPMIQKLPLQSKNIFVDIIRK